MFEKYSVASVAVYPKKTGVLPRVATRIHSGLMGLLLLVTFNVNTAFATDLYLTLRLTPEGSRLEGPPGISFNSSTGEVTIDPVLLPGFNDYNISEYQGSRGFTNTYGVSSPRGSSVTLTSESGTQIQNVSIEATKGSFRSDYNPQKNQTTHPCSGPTLSRGDYTFDCPDSLAIGARIDSNSAPFTGGPATQFPNVFKFIATSLTLTLFKQNGGVPKYGMYPPGTYRPSQPAVLRYFHAIDGGKDVFRTELNVFLTIISQPSIDFTGIPSSITLDVTKNNNTISGRGSVSASVAGYLGRNLSVTAISANNGNLNNTASGGAIPYRLTVTPVNISGGTTVLIDGALPNNASTALYISEYILNALLRFDVSFDTQNLSVPGGAYSDVVTLMFSTDI